MQSYKLFITLITLTFLTMGCGEKNPYHKAAKDDLVEVVTQDTEDIRNDTSTDNKEKAKRLAKIGELLLETPRGAELAAEIFEEALSFDQENGKANFYAAILKPIHALKGTAYRLTKIVTAKAMGDLIEDILSGIGNRDTQNLVSDFLTEARLGDMFKTVSEFQAFLASEFLPALRLSDERLAIVENTENFNLTFNYKHWQNGWHFRRSVSFDQAEVRSFRVALKGIATYTKLISAYNVDAALPLRDQFSNRRGVTLKEVVDAIQMQPKALTLNENAGNMLTSILNDISDSIEGLRTIARILNSDKIRDGYLLHPFKSHRHYANFIKGLNVASDILAGPMAVDIGERKDKKGEEVSVVFNFTALLSNPVSDLKTLMPTEFDKDGKKAAVFPDLSFGGTIPNGDLISAYCSVKDTPEWIVCP